jgi:hypothetical protein
MLLSTLLALPLMSAMPITTAAWGDHGHQIVVLIASRYLSEQARASVFKLLAEDVRRNEDYYKKQCPAVLALSRANTSTDKDKDRLLTEGLRCMVVWPDPPYVKYDRPYTANWHFVDIPLTSNSTGKPTTYQLDLTRECLLDNAKREKSGDCALLALERFRPVLANPRTGGNFGEDDFSRAEAFKFIIHIVGDLHQPLHCATDIDLTKPNDRGDGGGNGKIVEWLGKQTYTYGNWNLHAVWDEGILDKTLDAYKGKDDAALEAAYIDALKLPASGSPAFTKLSAGDIFAWAYESYLLAAEQAYAKLPPLDPKYKYTVLDRKTFKPVIDPQTGKPQTRLGGYRLTNAYYETNRSIVDTQLVRAGMRLARILNEDLAH